MKIQDRQRKPKRIQKLENIARVRVKNTGVPCKEEAGNDVVGYQVNG